MGRRLRDQWAGLLALFLVIAGGTAYAANTIGSSDIINGEVKSPDILDDGVASVDIKNKGVQTPDLAGASVQSGKVLDDSLTGADIDESTLNFACPAGFSAAGDICFGAAAPDADHPTAEADCQNGGLRLPSAGEARLIQVALGPPPSSTRTLWTDDHTSQTAAAAIFQNSDSLITVIDAAKTQLLAYACVRAPVRA